MKKNTRYSDNSYNSNKTQSRKSSSLSNLIDYQTSFKNSKPNSNKIKIDIKKKKLNQKTINLKKILIIKLILLQKIQLIFQNQIQKKI